MGNQYLEHELYCALVGELSDHKTYYLHSDYDGNKEAKNNLNLKSEVFTEIVKIPCPKFNDKVYSITGLYRLILYFKSMRSWKKKYLAEVNRIDPDRIVVLNPFLLNYMVISEYVSEFQAFYIQCCNTKRSYDKNMSTRGRVKSIFYAHILGVPVKSKDSNPLLAKRISKFIFWSKHWLPAINMEGCHEEKVEFVGNAMNDKLYDRFYERRSLRPLPRVLVCLNKESSMGIDAWNEYRNFYLKIFRENQHIDWLIKPHPLSNSKLIEDNFSEFTLINEINWDKVDVMMNHWSSVTWTSLILGVPTILVNPKGKFDLKIRFLENFEFVVYHVGDFKNIITSWKENGLEGCYEFRQKYLNRSFGAVDNQSTLRTARAIVG